MDVVEDCEEGEELCLRVEEDGMGGLVEYRWPVPVEGILVIYWLEVLLGFHRERLEWGVKNVGRVKAYICILASCLQ